MNINEIGYQCCFCSEGIKSTNVDPCDLNILINMDKSKELQENQSFYCHAHCFEQTLHDSIKGYLIVHLAD